MRCMCDTTVIAACAVHAHISIIICVIYTLVIGIFNVFDVAIVFVIAVRIMRYWPFILFRCMKIEKSASLSSTTREWQNGSTVIQKKHKNNTEMTRTNVFVRAALFWLATSLFSLPVRIICDYHEHTYLFDYVCTKSYFAEFRIFPWWPQYICNCQRSAIYSKINNLFIIYA